MFCPRCGAPGGGEGESCQRCGTVLPHTLWAELQSDDPDAHAETDPSTVGLLLEDRYRVEGLIARGGMGEVFRGRDVKLDRPIAIKFLAEKFRSDTGLVKRFVREARSAAKLYHPNTVTIHSVGEDKGRPFFVMQFVDGHSVAELVRARGRLPLAQAVGIAVQVCSGLEHIHDRSFVHRDIKPQNLMVDPKGRCIILDFGILRDLESDFTQTGMAAGTPDYMAPEQANDARKVDARSDIYSLGVTFFEMVTGRLPFQAESSLQRMLKHQSEPPPKPSTLVSGLPPEVDTIIETAMAKNPVARYQTAAELAVALRAVGSPVDLEGNSLTSEELLQAAMIQPAGAAAAATPTLTAPPNPTPIKGGSDISPSSISGESLSPSSSIFRRRGRRWLPPALAMLTAGAALAGWYFSREEPHPTPRAPVAVTTQAGTAPFAAPSPLPAAAMPPPEATPSPGQPLRRTASDAVKESPPEAAPARTQPRPSTSPRGSVRARSSGRTPRKVRARRTALEPTTGTAPQVAASVTPMPATLVVTSFPSGATVRAGKTIVGSTPIQGYRLGPGTYQVTLMKGGFVPWTRKLTLNAGRIHAVTATLTAVPATLRVVVLHQGKTTWATVSINGEAVGDTHAVKRRVSPGTYRITAFRRGYRRAHREVDLAPGSARMVQIVLEKE